VTTHDVTTGSIRGHLTRMSGFILLPMAVQVLYGLIDAFWVGWLGKQALAAVAIAGAPQLAVAALTQVLSVGTGSLVSQAAGRKDNACVSRWFTQSLVAAFVLGVLTCFVMFALRSSYLVSEAGDAVTVRLVRSYLVWFIPAMCLQFPVSSLTSALRGAGDVRSPSLTQLGTLLINTLLAPVLIFGCGTGVRLGVAGAALATLIASGAGAAVLIHLANHRRCFEDPRSAWRPRLDAWLAISKIGAPSAVEAGLIAFNFAFVIALLRPCGAAQQAAFGLGMRVLQAGMMPLGAVSIAVSATVGQNYGAAQPLRVRETFFSALSLGLAIAAVFVVLYHGFARDLMHVFSSDAAVIDAGEDFLAVTSWNLLFSAGIFACLGLFTGLGNTLPSLAGTASRIGLFVPAAFVLSQFRGFRPHGLWILYTTATAVQLVVALILARRQLEVRCKVQPSSLRA
jgi:putative MATE family efflux protein